MKLKRGLFIFMSLFISLTVLCAEVQAQTKSSPPVVAFVWAQEKIRQGDDWRIYIAASDPEGDMYRIYCRIDQPGGQVYRPDITNIKKGMEAQLSGYLVLRTFSVTDLFGTFLTLTLTIVDRAGNESQPISLPLTIDGERTKSPPSDLIPAGIEKGINQRISYIGFDLISRDRSWRGN